MLPKSHKCSSVLKGGKSMSQGILFSNMKASPHEDKINTKTSLTKITSILPTYVLDIKRPDSDEENEEEIEIKTEDLKTEASKKSLTKIEIPKADRYENKIADFPIFINIDLENIVRSVMEVLQRVSPQKFRKIIVKTRSPLTLQNILSNPDIHDFMDALYDKGLIYSSDILKVDNANILTLFGNKEFPRIAFKLHNPEKLIAVRLQIKDTSKTSSIERLFGQIKQNIVNHVSENSISIPVTMPSLSEVDSRERSYEIHTSMTKSFQNPKLSFQNKNIFNATNNFMKQKTKSYRKFNRQTLGTTADIKLSPAKNKTNMLQEVKTSTTENKSNTKDKYANEKFYYRKSTCPACIEKLSFSRKVNKPKYISDIITSTLPNKFVQSPKQMIQSKDTDDMLNVISQNASINTIEDSSWKRLYSDLEIFGRSSIDSSAIVNKTSEIHTVLRKLSNSERIQIGMKMADIKNREINTEGIVKRTSTPISAILDSVLPKKSILELTASIKLKEWEANANTNTDFLGCSDLVSRKYFGIDNSFRRDENKFSGDKFTVNARHNKLTETDLLRMKCEISEKELSKKIKRFLKRPNP